MTFTDIASHWAQPCIEELARRNLVRGYPDLRFRPEKPLTRAEFAVLVCRAFPEAETVKPGVRFTDIPEAYWAAADIHHAAERGFFSGYPDGSFQPNRLIPRIEAIVALASHLQLRVNPGENSALERWFDDAEDIPDYAIEAIAAAAKASIVVSHPNPKRFDPHRPLMRGEVAALLCRVLQIENVPLAYVVGVEAPPQLRVLPGFLNVTPQIYYRGAQADRTDGILVSTFPFEGSAHFKQPLKDDFEILTDFEIAAEGEAVYQSIVVQNASDRTATLEIRSGASYATVPDAPLQGFPETVENPDGTAYSGASSRVTDAVLRGNRPEIFPQPVVLEPGEAYLLSNEPISVDEAANTRTTLLRLQSSEPLYVASLVRSIDEPPTLAQWMEQLQSDEKLDGESAVLRGTRWRTLVTDNANSPILTVPTPGSKVCFNLHRELLDRSILLHQIGLTDTTDPPETDGLTDRGFDRTYSGIEYDITLPIYNDLPDAQTVSVSLSSPLSISDDSGSEIIREPVEFTEDTDEQTFCGTVCVTYEDFTQTFLTRFVHLTQYRGQQGSPLALLRIPPNSSRRVSVKFIYPIDGTPPQVLTLATL
ncbi:MAG: DUF3370 family protein [Cyanobacteria bacterium SID2]|nr:DUF3370 family protein [Cyanobacteria bacterium SID2]MBP0004415.1 DUF3370 family protein [Cyanobacteria bacterium SBC]